MAVQKTNLLVTNVLFWFVAALLHPLAGLISTESGGPPRVFSLLIPLLFLLLAGGSTLLVARAGGTVAKP
jgi:hypothetical protein